MGGSVGWWGAPPCQPVVQHCHASTHLISKRLPCPWSDDALAADASTTPDRTARTANTALAMPYCFYCISDDLVGAESHVKPGPMGGFGCKVSAFNGCNTGVRRGCEGKMLLFRRVSILSRVFSMTAGVICESRIDLCPGDPCSAVLPLWTPQGQLCSQAAGLPA